MKKILLIPGLIILFGVAGWLLFAPSRPVGVETVTVSPQVKEVLKAPGLKNPAAPPSATPPTQTLPQPHEEEPAKIPVKKEIDAPFIVQAPFANWEHPYDEACEEASVLMVHHFYQGTQELSQDEMKRDLDAITAWGLEYFTGAVDTSAQETADYFIEYLGYDPTRVFVRYDFTIDDIKAVLAQGYPVIVPVAGQDIGNRYFQQPGPVYHMLVITGYDKDTFIANDPGTKNGEGYVYDQQVLFDAIHDLTVVRENIREGRKAMIIVL